MLDYCRRLGVALEPFVQLNHNAYFHKPDAFGGAPQRIREIKADFDGGVAELLAKATHKGALDEEVTKEDREILLEALRELGALDQDYRYRAGPYASEVRGYKRPPGGGLSARPEDGEPIGLQRYSDFAAVARAGRAPRLRFPDHDVSAGRRHGPHRRGFRARTRRRDPLQRQSRRDRAG